MDLFSLLAKLTLDKTEYDDGLKEAEKSAENLKIATPQIPKTDNTEFNAGIKEAESTGNIFKDVMIGVWDGIKSALVTTGIVGVVSNIVSSMREGIQLATKNGDAISKGKMPNLIATGWLSTAGIVGHVAGIALLVDPRNLEPAIFAERRHPKSLYTSEI